MMRIRPSGIDGKVEVTIYDADVVIIDGIFSPERARKLANDLLIEADKAEETCLEQPRS